MKTKWRDGSDLWRLSSETFVEQAGMFTLNILCLHCYIKETTGEDDVF